MSAKAEAKKRIAEQYTEGRKWVEDTMKWLASIYDDIQYEDTISCEDLVFTDGRIGASLIC